MYRYLLSALTLLISTCSFAQKIRFCDTTNKWVYISREEHNPGHIMVNYSIREYYAGDSTIAGTSYYKLNHYDGRSKRTKSKFIRQDTLTNKVYEALITSSGGQTNVVEQLYLDFDLDLDDSITDGYDYYKVISIDSVLVDSQYHKEFFVSETQGRGIYNVIENISNYRLLPSTMTPDLQCFFNDNRRPFININSYKNQNDCSDVSLSIPDSEDGSLIEIKVFPQPATNKVTFTLPYAGTDLRVELYNLNGQLIYAHEYGQSPKEISVFTELVAGTYLYRITDKGNNRVFSGKLLWSQY